MAEISTLGKYEIRRQIGRGAMGVVYEGYDPLIKRIVALKTIRSDQLADDDSATVVARFRREAQAAGRLNHPNIVSIYDFGEDAGVWYIAMEFIKGRELKECFETNERFKITDIGRIMSQILGALDYSHRQGVIHRDIKPANIFLLPDRSVKVADFGIAHIEASNLTQAGTVMGTPSYMSPEQIQGLPVDGRSDLFSAGVILYQFLTGERPFAGSSTTTMQKVLKEDPMPPSMLNVQVMPQMDAVVRKALAKRPDERYQTAQEFADAISDAVAAANATATISNADATMMAPIDRTMLAPNRTMAKPAVATGTGAPVPPAPSDAPTSAPAARNPAFLVVGTAALVAVAAAGWFYYQQRAGSATTAAQAPPTGRDGTGRASCNAGAPARSNQVRRGDADHHRGRTRRSERPPVPGRQVADAGRPARRFQEPVGGKGRRPAGRHGLDREELRTAEDPPAVEERRLHHDGRPRRPALSSARTA